MQAIAKWQDRTDSSGVGHAVPSVARRICMRSHTQQQVTRTSFAASARDALRMVRAPGPVVSGAAMLVAVAIFLVTAAVAAAPTVSLTKPLAGAVVKGAVTLDV